VNVRADIHHISYIKFTTNMYEEYEVGDVTGGTDEGSGELRFNTDNDMLLGLYGKVKTSTNKVVSLGFISNNCMVANHFEFVFNSESERVKIGIELTLVIILVTVILFFCMAGTYWVCINRGRIFGTDPEEEEEEA